MVPNIFNSDFIESLCDPRFDVQSSFITLPSKYVLLYDIRINVQKDLTAVNFKIYTIRGKGGVNEFIS